MNKNKSLKKRLTSPRPERDKSKLQLFVGSKLQPFVGYASPGYDRPLFPEIGTEEGERVVRHSPLQTAVPEIYDRNTESAKTEDEQKKHSSSAKQQNGEGTATAKTRLEKIPGTKMAKSKNGTLMRKPVPRREEFPTTVEKSQSQEIEQAEAERHQANTGLNFGCSGRAAKHPEFEELHKRMKSFTGMFEAEAEDFAKCGYFLKGNGVTCFYCGNSPVEDKKIPDHIVGHWKYNPECQAANLSFAEQFVDIHSNETKVRPIETVIPEKACFDNTATLEEENRRLRRELKCGVCSKIKDAVFIPCGDNVFCMECAKKITVCPKCSKAIKNIIQAKRTMAT